MVLLGSLGFNTQPPEGGWVSDSLLALCAVKFQHTAARRRLELVFMLDIRAGLFQHTAARRRLGGSIITALLPPCFNTQPPEGGWLRRSGYWHFYSSFNTQPPEGGWVAFWFETQALQLFQHTAARRRLDL